MCRRVPSPVLFGVPEGVAYATIAVLSPLAGLYSGVIPALWDPSPPVRSPHHPHQRHRLALVRPAALLVAALPARLIVTGRPERLIRASRDTDRGVTAGQ